MASTSFVQQARANLVDTYTIVKREGDKMPAVPKQKVAGEKLPAPRLSIADIAGDPLASRIVDMTPEEVAQALNAMAPASGQEKMHLSRELSAVAKPRIVRERGEWIRKDGKGARSENDSPQSSKTTVSADKRGIAKESGLIAASASATLPIPPKTPAARRSEVQAAMPAELASLGEATASAPPGTVSIDFETGEVSLTKDATGTIDKNVVDALKTSPDSRIQIVAYAAASDGKESTARRTSLSRALSVRSYLISQGIDATRMDVRAMGVQTDQKAEADKVDMVLVPGKKS
jgi:outer membrane protein OmpA-like peptidoglycan-associated protein